MVTREGNLVTHHRFTTEDLAAKFAAAPDKPPANPVSLADAIAILIERTAA